MYRTLADIQVAQYMYFMSLLLGALQADPRTGSRPDGVIAGDTTQIAKPYAHKIPGVHVLFLHSSMRFVRGVEVITAHYADSDKDYPLLADFYQPTEEQKTPLSDGATRVAVSLPSASDESSASTRTPSNKTEINARIDLKTFEFIYLQAEPSIDANEVARIYDNQTRFVALGKSNDGQWIFVRLKDRTEGWIKKEFLVANQSLDSLSVQTY